MKVHHRNLPHVVVIGGGFGGLQAVKAFRKKRVRVTLIDRQNHHLFQPLLYQVATAALSPADIAEPLRHIFRKQENTEVRFGEVRRIDVDRKVLVVAEDEIPYDYLIIAAGARHSYFGKDEWERFAPGLKGLDDALEIRRRMLMAFELAEKTQDRAVSQAAMTFVVVGGGPTGVEMAGAISEIARHTLVKDFRHIDSSHARVILVDAAPRLIPAMAPELSENALFELRRVGVDVRLNARVENIDENGVTVTGGEHIPTRTVVWAAGNAASPLGASLGVPLDRAGRVIVKDDLSIPGHPEVFVIGDLAHFETKTGPLPGLSPVAMQQGRHAAHNICLQIAGGWMKPFEYFDKGTMATIGRNAAVADIAGYRFHGFLAWLAWAFIHLLFLVSFRNKAAVMAKWMYVYFTMGRGARLITGQDWPVKSKAPNAPPPAPPV